MTPGDRGHPVETDLRRVLTEHVQALAVVPTTPTVLETHHPAVLPISAESRLSLDADIPGTLRVTARDLTSDAVPSAPDPSPDVEYTREPPGPFAAMAAAERDAEILAARVWDGVADGDMPNGHQPPAPHEDGCGSCDLYAAQLHVADKLEALTAAVNILGAQVQWLTNGTMGLFEVIHSIGPDLKSMGMGDKIALLKQLMGS